MKQHNILITSAGKRVVLTRAFKDTLAKYDSKAKVYTTDMNPEMAPAGYVSDECIQVPRCTADNYVELLLQICKEKSIGLIIPTIDTELLILAINRLKFEELGVVVSVPSMDFVAICRDKRNTGQFLEAHGIRIPAEVDKYNPVFPLFAKPYDGSLSANLHYITKPEELTDDIISNGNFSLYSDYYQLFKIPGKLCDESIFECQCTDFGNGSGDLVEPGEWFICQGPVNSGNISGWGHCGVYESFRDWAYERGETVRATTSFLLAGETTPSGDYINPRKNPANADCWNGKAYTPASQLTPGRTKYGTNNNIRIFRYADVLLMNAEAKIRNGKNGDAPFNEVRRRAEMPELTNVTVNQVLDERRMELFFEWGERYTDLLRTGLAATELKELNWTEENQYFPVPFNQYTQIPDLLLEPKDE